MPIKHGFILNYDFEDTMKFRDEKHGTWDSVHLPADRLCVWVGWLEPLIETVSIATKKTMLEVLQELLVESGHKLTIDIG